MNKRSVLDIDFSSLEKRALIPLSRSQGKVNMLKAMEHALNYGSSIQQIKSKKGSSDMADALLYGMMYHSVIFDELQPEPHCQKKVFDIIDNFWKNPQFGAFHEYIAKNPKTKNVFKSKSTKHYYPWYRKGDKY